MGDNDYDVEATVDYILNLTLINSRLGLPMEASGGSTTQPTKETDTAKQILPKKLPIPGRGPSPRHISNSKRKQLNKEKRKGQNEENKNLETQNSNDNMDTQSLLKSLQLLSI